ncbi:MAG: pyrroline-5-carboxylate reductase [Treponema sp.]|jgi:pyrroline-5-carboxylate reductase|nr:pyrroline-5-carboxylate reductase [Treponema sp.]
MKNTADAKVLIACIGAGAMGTALMKGAASAAGGGNIIFTDVNLSKARAAAKALGAGVRASNLEAARASEWVFLAVKPQALPGVLAEIAPALGEAPRGKAGAGPPVLVSMAAGWSIARIQAVISGAGKAPAVPAGDLPPVVRIMPNTPAQVSRGLIALAASPAVGASRLAALERILGGAGMVDQVEEPLLDAATGLSGSGPAFVCQFIEALADGGVLAGLPRDKALRYAAQTVLGTAAMVLETGKHPGALKDLVASPGGTTIEGIAVLERNAFRGTVISAVEAAWRRSLDMAAERQAGAG